MESLRSNLKNEISILTISASNIDIKLVQFEKSLSCAADSNSVSSLKYVVEADLYELKTSLHRLIESCSIRHEKLAEQGSISDLKARVDGAARKISSLEDFRHNSADRYVLMANYQHDIKLVTDAIGMIRNELRIVMDMVDSMS